MVPRRRFPEPERSRASASLVAPEPRSGLLDFFRGNYAARGDLRNFRANSIRSQHRGEPPGPIEPRPDGGAVTPRDSAHRWKFLLARRARLLRRAKPARSGGVVGWRLADRAVSRESSP